MDWLCLAEYDTRAERHWGNLLSSANRRWRAGSPEELKTQGGGLTRAAGDTGNDEDRAAWQGPIHSPRDDPPLKDKPERPCTRCGKSFQPTLKRRLLCAGCFRRGDAGMV